MSFYHITKTTNGNYRLKIDNKVDPLCAGNPSLIEVGCYCEDKYGVTPVLNVLHDETILNYAGLVEHVIKLEIQLAQAQAKVL